MTMYDKLAARYDQMIRWKTRLERETPFFQKLFVEKRIKEVLDLGCGTGQHARLFHKWGCDITCVDPSAELLKIAGDGFEEEDSIRFINADFLTFPEHVSKSFDIVICLGNSLPHVNTIEELKQTFRNVFHALKPGGMFVFQNRNYDRLLETKERFLLPLTHRVADNEQIFFRFNDFLGNKVRFNVVHFTRVAERWIHEVYSMELEPLVRDDVVVALKEAGFSSIDLYGDYSGTPFDPQSSSDLIGMVRRPS